MGDLRHPFISLDPRLDYGRNMTDCEVAGISGLCGPGCPALGKGQCNFEVIPQSGFNPYTLNEVVDL